MVLNQAHPWQAHRTSLDSHVEEKDTEEREDDDEFAADSDHDYEAMVMKLIILVRISLDARNAKNKTHLLETQ